MAVTSDTSEVRSPISEVRGGKDSGERQVTSGEPEGRKGGTRVEMRAKWQKRKEGRGAHICFEYGQDGRGTSSRWAHSPASVIGSVR
jgi:hypothetical protein